jgi:hypothetical protein
MPLSPSVGPLAAAGAVGGVNWAASYAGKGKATGTGTSRALPKRGDTNP